MDWDGILLVDKPLGWTSHDVVAKIRGILKSQAGQKVKVGHTGTLDPRATGLMIIVVGSYCKRAQEFSKLDKTYEITMKLGETSTTGDSEGEMTKISSKTPPKTRVKEAIAYYTKTYEQTPSAYSAIKIGGQRAYKLAREGNAVKPEPRRVTIYKTKFVGYNYPFVNFIAEVSSGTYIRSLVEDIGEKLEIGAYLSKLRRAKVSEYSIEEAINIQEVNIDKIAKVLYYKYNEKNNNSQSKNRIR